MSHKTEPLKHPVVVRLCFFKSEVLSERREDVFDDWNTPGFAEQPVSCSRGQVTHICVVIREPKQSGNKIL